MKKSENAAITTGVVAAHCQVSYETVKAWIRRGQLKAYTTPGRRHYVLLDDFRAFLEVYGMPPYDTPASRNRKILVVDDDRPIVGLINAFFEKLGGYECAVAFDGYEAGIQVLKFAPDLVILDLFMPSINGFDVCRNIKNTPETRHILVLAITGHLDEQHASNALAAGADACLLKPFLLETLHERVETLFSTRQKP